MDRELAGQAKHLFLGQYPKIGPQKKSTKADIGALNAFVSTQTVPMAPIPNRPRQRLCGLASEATGSLRRSSSTRCGGLQGFWLMHNPVALNGPGSVEQFEAYNRQLETDLGGDHCHNIDRIMRLPGTINVPNAPKDASNI